MSNITINQLHMALCEANSILLTVHIRPDGDAIGSMLAFYEALIAQGKTVHMVVDDVIPEKFSFLKYIDYIHDVSYLETNAISVDMLMVLDASTYERIGRVGALCSAPIFNIDHHISNTKFADYLYLKSNFAATGEIITYLCKEWNWPITESMGTALYMAIATDCGFFKFSNTTAHTLEMASYCVAAGAHPNVVSETIEAISVDRLELTKQVMQTIGFYKHNTVATIELCPAVMAILGDDTDGFVDIIRNVDTVDIAILLKGESPNRTRISLRSKGTDVNAIAQQFGGGGHIRAAGCTIMKNIEEAKSELLEAIG
ncbi:DHH family phosphoesterase [Veillonella caviae]|uniref:DHH family phosphoesterase n=1 Tax=Veillonella caviae TaxID=248316 RepID=UPI0023A79FBD|nr:bifunctional oligoribonuclease/PAP phosphatase NrnA [Veillonella caviae]MCI5708474.1 bifunctional oligoribonuclease/PAP phosphatase NrnA [Veillonella caviae]MCI7693287.1 bifunctional oligoribonuclease/PAP phosphatase NrnA [Veillonella caviae]MDD7290634.1 bifunctional oligoribonuclease/PAP phosphatase NrnA [Veillonella caviae]MDY5253671.1 bifunctional oligoribonuclease/PAP phosphatase NrnA [Veillonella caviae]MDY5409070.1 bifunctional oligoribonuclease/PAP phosphatase NrnA [Veillonella cavia